MAKTYQVSGMSCGGCVRSVEQAIKAAAPGARVEVDLVAQKVTVDGAEEQVVAKAVSGAGFEFLGAV
jgi:copper chaperone